MKGSGEAGTAALRMMGILFLISCALGVCGLVFAAHLVRHRLTMAPFFALLGCLAAVTVWITDTQTQVQVGPFTFLFGSVVFFLALLLGVFLAYVFDGARSGQVAIGTVVGVTVLAPLFAAGARYQTAFAGTDYVALIPLPSARVYFFSAGAMLADFVAMAIVWQALANCRARVPMALRVFATILAALWLDALIFTTGALRDDPEFLGILRANILSRFAMSAAASPLVAAYVAFETRRHGLQFANRPLLSILRLGGNVERELSTARHEIELRRAAELSLATELAIRESLFAAIPYPVFYKDTQLRYLGCNTAYEELSGMRAAELEGRTAHDVWPEMFAERYTQEDVELLANPGIRRFETKSIDHMGVVRDVIVSKATFEGSDGKVAGIVSIVIDITERKRMEGRLEELASTDAMTGTWNRRRFLELLREEHARALRYERPLSIVVLDADRFKEINDSHGHAVGDEVLVAIAGACRLLVRDQDHVGRLGGEEFGILLVETDIERAFRVADRIRAAISEHVTRAGDVTVKCTVSVGVAQLHPGVDIDGAALMNRADLCMYEGKRGGGNCVVGED